MARKRYTEEQNIGVLTRQRQGPDRGAVPQSRHERRHLLQVESQVRRADVERVEEAKSIEEENRRLKQIVAQQALDNWSLKELLAKTSEAQGEKLVAAYAIESLGLSERRASLLTGISPSVYRYKSKQGP